MDAYPSAGGAVETARRRAVWGRSGLETSGTSERGRVVGLGRPGDVCRVQGGGGSRGACTGLLNASLGSFSSRRACWWSACVLNARGGAIRARGRSQGKVRLNAYCLAGEIVEKCSHLLRVVFLVSRMDISTVCTAMASEAG